MRTPKKVLGAVKARERRLEKALEMSSSGARMRGETRWLEVESVAKFVKLSSHLKNNRVKLAVDLYLHQLSDRDMPLVIVDYLERVSLQLDL